MCFSATASFLAATTLTSVGVVTAVSTKEKKELPLALIPVFFGVQQFIEGFVWLSFSWNNALLNTVSTNLFVLFAFVIWPIYIPHAVRLVETVPWRRKGLTILQVFGILVGLFLIYSHIHTPVTSEIINKCIVYNASYSFEPFVVIAYLSSTALSLLISSKKSIQVFGILVLTSALISWWFYFRPFISVWCFFAAILSLYIFLVFKKGL